jgi:hypothetical protein
LGYHPLAKSVGRVRIELNEPLPAFIPPLSSGEINAAMRNLRAEGLAVEARSGAQIIGWQRTPAGMALIEGWVPPTFTQDTSDDEIGAGR